MSEEEPRGGRAWPRREEGNAGLERRSRYLGAHHLLKEALLGQVGEDVGVGELTWVRMRVKAEGWGREVRVRVSVRAEG